MLVDGWYDFTLFPMAIDLSACSLTVLCFFLADSANFAEIICCIFAVSSPSLGGTEALSSKSTPEPQGLLFGRLLLRFGFFWNLGNVAFRNLVLFAEEETFGGYL